jgi:cytochrome P450
MEARSHDPARGRIGRALPYLVILLTLMAVLHPLFLTRRCSFAQSEGDAAGAEVPAEGAEQAAASGCPYAPTSGPGEPKTVGALKFLAGLRRHYTNPVHFFEDFHERYGRTFRISMPCGLKFLFDMRQEAFSGTLLKTDAGDGSWEKPPLLGHGVSFLLGKENIFLGSGEVWRQGHNAMKPYLDGKAMNNDASAARILAILDEHVESLKSRISASSNGELEIDICEEMSLAILDVALRVLLGVKLQPADLANVQHGFRTAMQWLPAETLNMTDVSLSRCAWIIPGAAKLRDAYRTVSAFADNVIAARKASGSPGEDLLGGLLKHRDATTGQPFDDDRLRGEVLSVMIAGYETTAALLSWAVAEMAHKPAEYAKLKQVVDGMGSTPPGFTALKRTEAIENVVNESLRLYAPKFFLVRRAAKDTTLGPPEAEVKCPKGTMAVISPYQANRDEEKWGAEKTGFAANEFHPERFARPTPKMYSFGGGVRVCLGLHMARLESGLMLYRFAQNFDLELKSEATMAVASELSTHPSDGRMKLRLRRAAH